MKQIRQIPGVTGVISTLYDSVPGEAWPLEDFSPQKEIEDAGLQLAGIESVNIHDAIKTGSGKGCLHRQLHHHPGEPGKADIHVVACYNFMPVFDWTRTELAARVRFRTASTVLAYTQGGEPN